MIASIVAARNGEGSGAAAVGSRCVMICVTRAPKRRIHATYGALVTIACDAVRWTTHLRRRNRRHKRHRRRRRNRRRRRCRRFTARRRRGTVTQNDDSEVRSRQRCHARRPKLRLGTKAAPYDILIHTFLIHTFLDPSTRCVCLYIHIYMYIYIIYIYIYWNILPEGAVTR